MVCFFSIKIHDLSELKEVYTIVDVEEEKGMACETAPLKITHIYILTDSSDYQYPNHLATTHLPFSYICMYISPKLILAHAKEQLLASHL